MTLRNPSANQAKHTAAQQHAPCAVHPKIRSHALTLMEIHWFIAACGCIRQEWRAAI
jgi:hypothetical protein